MPTASAGGLSGRPAGRRPARRRSLPGRRSAGGPGCRRRPAPAGRGIDAPDTAVPLDCLRDVCRADGFRHRIRHRGTDLLGLAALAAAGHGLTALPLPLATALPDLAAVPVAAPRLVHRTELLHPAEPATAVRTLAELLTGAQG
ncbi:LysR substrate-binding domain-containing protein [Streptacidiphilus fuscans]|uniref:LysR substrate-binding domain-containing protein n=1 Tax=Streptacidiphilus fuscans TaxID=2789292 RepID=UPI001F262268|nr:LysR substrate-binding domain-containing protein [Streptacidiphilus fuscans]